MANTNLTITIQAQTQEALNQLRQFSEQAKAILGNISVTTQNINKPGGGAGDIIKQTAVQRIKALQKEFKSLETQIKSTYQTIGTIDRLTPTGQASQNLEKYYDNISKLLAKQKDVAVKITKTRTKGEDAAALRSMATEAIPQIVGREEVVRGEKAKNTIQGLTYELSKLTNQRYENVAAMNLGEKELKKYIAAKVNERDMTLTQIAAAKEAEKAGRAMGLAQIAATKEGEKLTQQAKAAYLKSTPGMINQIARNWAVADAAQRKYSDGINITASAVKQSAAAWENQLRAQHLSNKELKQTLRSSQDFKDISARQMRVGGTILGSGGIEPDPTQRHGLKATIDDLRRQRDVLMGTHTLTAMQKMRDFYADSAKYARFQLRWFASATTIFAVAGAVSAAARATMQFYQSLKDIQAITGESEAGIKLISNAAIEVAKKTPIAASQATQMGLKLIQAGLNAEQTAEAMKTVAAIVTVSGEGMTEASKAVTTAMFAWHLPAEKIPKIGQTIAAALNFSRLTVDDLGTAFNYLAATSSVMNHSLEETTANMAVLSNMGLRASTIGTSLSHAYSELISPSKQFSAELKRLGISANEVNPSLVSFADIIEILTKKGFSATKSFEMFGDRAGRIIASAIVAGAPAFRKMKEDIDKSTQLTKGLEKAMEGPIKALARLRNAMEIAVIQLGAVGVPVIKGATDVLSFMMLVVRKLTEGYALLVESLGSTITVITILTTTVTILAWRSFPALLSSLRATVTGIRAVTFSALTLNTVLKKMPWYLVASIAVSAIGFLASIFSSAGKEADQLAESSKQLAASQMKAKEAAEKLAEAQKKAEIIFTNLKEAWDDAAKDTVKLPIIDQIITLQIELDEAVKKLKELKELQVAPAPLVFQEKKPLHPIITSPGGFGIDYVKAALATQQATNKLKELAKRDIVGEAIGEMLRDRSKTDIQQLSDFYEKAKGIQKAYQDAIKQATPKDEAEALKIFAVFAEQMKKLVSETNIDKFGEKWHEQFLKAKGGADEAARSLEALNNEYEDLVNSSPYLKINRREAKEIGEAKTRQEQIIREIVKKQREQAEFGADKLIQATPALKEEYDKLGGAVLELAREYGELAKAQGIIPKIADEERRQETLKLVAQEIDYAKERNLLGVEYNEQMLELQKTYEGMDALTKLEQEIELYKQRAAIERWDLEVQYERARVLAEGSNSAAADMQLKKAKLALDRQVNEELLKTYELQKKLYEQTSENFGEAFVKGLKSHYDEMLSTYQMMEQAGKDTAKAIQNSFSSVYYKLATMEGFDREKHKNYWEYVKDVADSFMQNIYQSFMKMLADMWAEFMMKMLRMMVMRAIAGMSPYAATNPYGNAQPYTVGAGGQLSAHSGGLIMHQGGIIPRYHSGGLAPDEKLLIAQTGEMVINRKATARNMNTLTAINQGKDVGGGGVTNIIINATDPKSWRDYVRRNPGPIIEAFSKDMRLAGSSRSGIRAYS